MSQFMDPTLRPPDAGQRQVLTGVEARDKRAEIIGAKALRLAELPESWVPEFVVLTDTFASAWRVSKNAANILEGLMGPDNDALQAMLGHRTTATLSDTQSLFIRSNTTNEEAQTEHGKYESISVVRDFTNMCTAIDQVMANEPETMRIIVQLGIEGVNGRVSNERRVSRRSSEAMVEGLQGEQRQYVRRASASGPDDPLKGRNAAGVKRSLSRLARWVADQNMTYFSAEWVWDGFHLWIVQWQPVTANTQLPWVIRYLQTHEDEDVGPSNRPLLPIWEIADPAALDQWPKLQKSQIFRHLDIPTAEIRILKGSSWRSGLAGPASEELMTLLRGGDLWVIRTDVSSGSTVAKELLPTSAPLSSTETLSEFLRSTATELSSRGVAPEAWAFLASPLVRARASAMAYGVPGSPSVQVDSIWGFPDGLLYLPHDRALVNPTINRPATVSAAYKPACLLFSNSAWSYCDIQAPWDYGQVLDETELKIAARWAKAVSDYTSSEVQLMIMCRVGGRRGASGMLAFHYSSEAIVRPQGRPTEINPRQVFTVGNTIDLDLASTLPPGQFSALLLKPQRPLRDQRFLERLSRLARRNNKPILFSGSLLGHAYHILSSSGAMVYSVEAAELQGPATTYSKLVRDRIPAIVQQSGSIARVRPLSPREAESVLKQKLVEESLEVFSASGAQNVQSELADVAEVLASLAELYPGGAEEIEVIRRNKRNERGGFEDLTFLEFTRPTLIESSLEQGLLPVNFGDSIEAPVSSLTVEADSGGTTIRFKVPLVPSNASETSEQVDPISGRTTRLTLKYDAPDARIQIQVSDGDQATPSQPSLFDE